ncbi:hypothetical protein ASD65_09975 [Microbacterium sp. Root61]|uniref:acyl-CoA dehydrogenase family protein n=1 Tax=Microbacterium sp. Root61 TaxID=1736570 RepID=UPI0006FED26D|nr:acyl-CoA dehydrogenase family protein [Microbacterium sp. Root61]KRA24708.1 hypothetical protein ASD65_09975 [Microbacterium sp. Root61]
MRALIDETQKEFQEVAREIARSVGIENPADVVGRDTFSGWQTLASSGLLDLRERSSGDPTASGVEIALLCEELGGTLTPDPYLPSAVVAGDLIARSGDVHGWMAGLGSGDDRYGILLRADLTDFGDAGGDDDIVWGGAGDDGFVLALKRDGDSVRLVRGRPTGSTPLDSLSLTNALWRAADIAWEDGGALSAEDLQRVTALALTGLSADTVGALGAALRGVVEYSKQRRAYGVHIGSFQAIQHISADAYVAVAGARSAALYAAWAVDALDAGEALLAARTAKAACAHIGRTTAEAVMQVYGGIGQTWEHIAHFYNRRAQFDTAVLGDENHQLDAIADVRLEGK